MTRSFFSAAASGKNFCRHIAAESKFFAGHITQIFIHAVQQFHIRPVQPNAERGKVFLQTLDMRALGDHHDAAVDLPGQHQLRRCHFQPRRRLGDPRIGLKFAVAGTER